MHSKDSQKLSQKTTFLAYSKRFLVYTLLRPMSYAPIFYHITDVIKIHTFGKFHQYSICDCQVKNFKIMCSNSASIIQRFLGVFGPSDYPNMVQFSEPFTRGSTLANKNSHILSTFDVPFLKMAKIKINIFLENPQPLAKYVKIIFYTTQGIFLTGNRLGLKVKVSESKFGISYYSWSTSCKEILVPALSRFAAIGHKEHFRKSLTGVFKFGWFS